MHAVVALAVAAVTASHHDGLLDVVRGSDLVTVSWSVFSEHDAGQLRVTLHHNLLSGLNQRAPRVRHGKVHVYNNAYVEARAGAGRIS
ncbi:hypothetical protein ACBR40_14995 [Nonomuraea sp. AD125B]|uniref:pectate lyase family protein n=1 Tax=Nonomuraea sp. AD125B TaxID=3242897 RepID=UPI0035281170